MALHGAGLSKKDRHDDDQRSSSSNKQMEHEVSAEVEAALRFRSAATGVPLVLRSPSPVSEADAGSKGEISDVDLPSEEEDAGPNAADLEEVIAISSDESGPVDAIEEENGTETVSAEGNGRARADLPRADTIVGKAQGVGRHHGSAGVHGPTMENPAGGEEGSSRRVAAEAEGRRGRGDRTVGAAAGAAAVAGVAAAAAAGAATAAAEAAAVAAGAVAAATATVTTCADDTTPATTCADDTTPATTTVAFAEAAGVALATGAGRAGAADHRGGGAAVSSADGHVDVARARRGTGGSSDVGGSRDHRLVAPTADAPARSATHIRERSSETRRGGGRSRGAEGDDRGGSRAPGAHGGSGEGAMSGQHRRRRGAILQIRAADLVSGAASPTGVADCGGSSRNGRDVLPHQGSSGPGAGS
ncbi:predicted GPI-anchored protein 23 [Drosophila elegans]|uniref:predicted GPI-anchored protein 23 n=1 Tax=Drosophila elegans TaxID=30023 RepID=UPI001BC85D33|nr:predicted GPI-anchored protein 23 [Drosophila elegans]